MAPKRIKNQRRAGRADPVDEYFREVSRFAAASGAHVAAFAVGPDGNVRAYGSPSVDSVLEEYERRYGGGEGLLEQAYDALRRRYVEEKAREHRANGGGVVDEDTTLMWELELLDDLKKKVAVAIEMNVVGGAGGGSASTSTS